MIKLQKLKDAYARKRINIVILFAQFLFILLPFKNFAQQHYTVSIPDKDYVLESKKTGQDPLSLKAFKLVEQIAKLHNLQSSISCVQKMNPILEDTLRKVMKTIHSETPYVLVMDWDACRFLGLSPDKDPEEKFGSFGSQYMTVYHLKLFPALPSEPVIKSEKSSIPSKPLIATFLDESGKWVAMGPYTYSDPFATEKQAIGALFYSDSEITFLCQRGKFKIYNLNTKTKLEDYATDIRAQLEQLDIKDIPNK